MSGVRALYFTNTYFCYSHITRFLFHIVFHAIKVQILNVFCYITFQLPVIAENVDGLCCKLLQTCMKPRSLIWAFDRGKPDEYATTRDTVLRVRKLGSGQFAEVWLGRCT